MLARFSSRFFRASLGDPSRVPSYGPGSETVVDLDLPNQVRTPPEGADRLAIRLYAPGLVNGSCVPPTPTGSRGPQLVDVLPRCCHDSRPERLHKVIENQ